MPEDQRIQAEAVERVMGYADWLDAPGDEGNPYEGYGASEESPKAADLRALLAENKTLKAATGSRLGAVAMNEVMDTAELRALLEKATKGPWEARFRFGQKTTVAGRQRFPICDTGTAPHGQANVPREEANAALIVYAVNALPTLLANLDKLATENESLRLAILGGEDAPGVAASLSLETVLDLHRQNVSERMSRAESADANREGVEPVAPELADAAREALAFLRSIEGSGYGGMSDYDCACAALADALSPSRSPVGGEAVAEAFRKGAMAALGCARWDDADDFFTLVGMDYAQGKPLPATMPSPAPAQGDVAGLVEAAGVAAWRFSYTAKLMRRDPAMAAIAPSMDEAAADLNAALSALSSTRGVGIEEAAADDDLKGLVEAATAVVDSGCLVDAPSSGGEALSVNPDALDALSAALAACHHQGQK